MQQNITKVSERGERLDTLQDKTDSLATQANGFRRGANRVRKQMWWKDMKMRMCIIIGIIILLVVIIVPSGKSFSHGIEESFVASDPEAPKTELTQHGVEANRCVILQSSHRSTKADSPDNSQRARSEPQRESTPTRKPSKHPAIRYETPTNNSTPPPKQNESAPVARQQ